MSRIPGMRKARPVPVVGVRAESNFCRCCGLPICPNCSGCTMPIWPMPLSFQCECGWSGEMIVSELPDDIAAAVRGLWDGLGSDAEGIII